MQIWYLYYLNNHCPAFLSPSLPLCPADRDDRINYHQSDLVEESETRRDFSENVLQLFAVSFLVPGPWKSSWMLKMISFHCK